MGRLEGGVKFLVDLRSDLLASDTFDSNPPQQHYSQTKPSAVVKMHLCMVPAQEIISCIIKRNLADLKIQLYKLSATWAVFNNLDMATTAENFRFNVFTWFKLGIAATACYTELVPVYAKSTVFRWFSSFREAAEKEEEPSFLDQPHSSRPRSTQTPEFVEAVDQDCQVTTQELNHELDVGKSTMHEVLTQDLQLRNVASNTMEGMNTTGDMGQNLRAMDHALKETLTLWFSVGFLTLERVTWNSPCAMLQKISEYEAVHPVRNWTDLKRRVGPYRRCFVYTHHSMPGEPIVVLHTALTNEISQSIASIVARTHVHSIYPMIPVDQETMGGVGKEGKMEDCSHINTAIFYSITSTHKGLKGIDMGNYLIKQVVKKLQMEFPDMKQFSSLSPIPGFRSWLLTVLHKAERGEVCILEPQEESELSHLLSCEKSQFWKELQNVIGKNKWIQDDRMVNALETPLLRLCVQYLAIEKHRGYALNSVANFHLRNGAMIWRVNWKADLSPRGLSGSCSIMVNYRYFLDACEINSQHYLEEYQIEASEQVLHLAQRAQDVASMSRRSKL
ncbi:unnamed protein product [Darwinula stevensoni]|nr:unnamed protein product [Darwinula stevensoni]CAG0883604.1 unnamed protein product [Darwinula stevensoni]